MQNAELAAAEVRRVAGRGFKVALVRPIDAQGNYPNSPLMDPVWRAIEDSGLVLGMHAFPAGEAGPGVARLPSNAVTQFSPGELVAKAGRTTGVAQNLRSDTLSFVFEGMTWCSSMLLSGFLDRYPNLKVAIFECNASWLPMMLDVCDQAVNMYRRVRTYPLSRLPSEAFQAQCVLSFESDESPVFRMHDLFADIGIWASDAYHSDGADAWSALDLMEKLSVPADAEKKLMGDNARRFYGIDPKLFVTDRPGTISRPDWWPTEDEIAAALSPAAALGSHRSVMVR
jgi:predicted TIM-barrel fold metal-dependent hydrolase